jgi:hypothetical protein
MTQVFTGPLLSLRNLVSEETRRASVSKAKRLRIAATQYKKIKHPKAYAEAVAFNKKNDLNPRLPARILHRLYTSAKPGPVTLPKINLPDVPED